MGRLDKEVNAALTDPKMKARLAALDGIALTGSPTEFAQLIADETEKWAKVIRIRLKSAVKSTTERKENPRIWKWQLAKRRP